MKQTFYILTLTLGLPSCNGQTKKTDDNPSIPKTTDSFVSAHPQQFKLADSNVIVNSGDYYLSTEIDYFFSGIGDANAMDETPYITESAEITLDSIVDFLNQNGSIRISIFVPNRHDNYDSCVHCSFEMIIKEYLVSKGINEDRVVCSISVKGFRPAVDSFEGIQLVIN